MITQDELDKIVERLRKQRTDDSLVEAKSCTNSLTSDVWETVSSFANTAGGLVILGLAELDGMFEPVEKFDIDRVRDQFVTGIGDGGQPAAVTHVPRYELSRGFVDGSQVLLIQIKELDIREKPCFITARGVQGGSYKRVDDKDVRLSPAELYGMQSVLTPSDADGGIVPEATVDDLDQELVKVVIDRRRRLSSRALRGAETIEAQMERLNFTNKEGSVRLAGLLAAGIYPQQYYPKLVIDVAAHAGSEKSEPGAPRFIDRKICDGPLSACIEDALAAIGRNLRTTSYVVGAGRTEEWEIPEEVLREALANAVIHREYSPMFVGESVSVDIYPDRVEISNPGGLWGGKTIDTLTDGNSRCRNPKLMSLMGAVPLEHAEGYVAESQGSGIRSMIREMTSRSLGAPRFVAKPDNFKVILGRHGAELARNRMWLTRHVDRDLSLREETLLMLLREQGTSLTVGDMRRELGWDSDDIRLVCAGLLNDGLVETCGEDEFKVPPSLESDDEGDLHSGEALGERVLALLAVSGEASARDMANLLGVPISRIRYELPKLIEKNLILPTAGTYSKNRKYVLKR